MRSAHPQRAFHFESRGDLRGSWDAARLRQLLVNLLGNAVQHGSTVAPIDLSVCGDEDEVTLEVRNQVQPIPRHHLETIFEPLIREPLPEWSGPSGSIGLGLYIVREIASGHGGTVAASSSEKETVFTLRLPRHPIQRIHAPRTPLTRFIG